MGKLVYAELMLSGTRLRLYQFTPPDGEGGYFNAIGENIRSRCCEPRWTASASPPVSAADPPDPRLQPDASRRRFRRGEGTAVYAAGDGRSRRPVSGYGNYIEISTTSNTRPPTAISAAMAAASPRAHMSVRAR